MRNSARVPSQPRSLVLPRGRRRRAARAPPRAARAPPLVALAVVVVLAQPFHIGQPFGQGGGADVAVGGGEVELGANLARDAV